MKQIVLPMNTPVGATMACHRTAALASAPGASVTVVHVPPNDAGTDCDASPVLDMLPSDAVRPLENAGIAFRVRYGHGRRAEVTLTVAEAIAADLIVVGRKARSPLGRHALGAFTHDLLHRASTPVAIIPPPNEQAPRAGVTPLAIAAVDGTQSSNQIILRALQLATALDLDLEALTVRSFGAESTVRERQPGDDGDPDGLTRIALHELFTDLDPDSRIRVEAHTEVGFVPDALVEHANGGELLIMGRRRRSRIAEHIHGSASHYCATRAACPVVLVPLTDVPERARVD